MAFTATERAKIVSSNVPAHANPNYSTSPGNATTDKIFLLSITEAKNYFSSSDDRKADATRNVVMEGIYAYGGLINITCDVHCYADWLLRSPGGSSSLAESLAAIVNADGSVNNYGVFVSIVRIGVRPALWVNY